jgi:tRNA pseudouridine38-40 synthase
MPTYRLDLSYDGSGFRGYAKQSGQRTVQGELENALGTFLGEVPDTSVAGRTDAGVHARGQVVSFEFDDVDDEKLVRSLNSLLGGEVVVTRCSRVEPGFSARFSATARTYRYLFNGSGIVDPVRRHFEWTVTPAIDVHLLRETAGHFVGEIDFTSFCRSVVGKSNVRHVEYARWEEAGEHRHAFWVKANAFCHQMVRSLVGLSYDVARGHLPLAEVQEIIDRKDRSTMGTVAPPHGLTLWEVDY